MYNYDPSYPFLFRGYNLITAMNKVIQCRNVQLWTKSSISIPGYNYITAMNKVILSFFRCINYIAAMNKAICFYFLYRNVQLWTNSSGYIIFGVYLYNSYEQSHPVLFWGYNYKQLLTKSSGSIFPCRNVYLWTICVEMSAMNKLIHFYLWNWISQ